MSYYMSNVIQVTKRNQSKLSSERNFLGMLRLGPSDPGLAQPIPISHLIEDGKNATTNFSFS